MKLHVASLITLLTSSPSASLVGSDDAGSETVPAAGSSDVVTFTLVVDEERGGRVHCALYDDEEVVPVKVV